MKAVVVDPSTDARLVLAEVADPTPGAGDVVVGVRAFSLNRGEVRTALTEAGQGARPGWDFAGVVEQGAADGSGPAVGTRVVGLAPAGAWVERIATSPIMIAVLPDNVGFEAAASLPVAGLTALHALRKRSKLEGARVLVTGASGGVGVYGVQLAKHMGAKVTAAIRNPAHEGLVRQLGAERVAIGADLAQAAEGPFDLVLDGVGGQTLGAALEMLAPGGTCVVFGASESAVTTFDAGKFRPGGTSLYGLYLGWELQFEPPAVGLAHLAQLVGEGALDPMVEVVRPWTEVAETARDLMDRRYAGKAVLTVGQA
ncbi:MAG TPA: zinc-binding dehydrogenase [Caulobacteraceae bacterium]|jgi:NADPH:quinone reductase-like Zn-dependent oxidoreductase|nr:zinc-binding dehydrogenase [Caulobacteraceae bacterium]